jgi:hypothetical protein
LLAFEVAAEACASGYANKSVKCYAALQEDIENASGKEAAQCAALKDKSASMFASAHKRVKYIILYHATLAHSDFFFSKMDGWLTGRAGL